jgi:hypothetical protein
VRESVNVVKSENSSTHTHIHKFGIGIV